MKNWDYARLTKEAATHGSPDALRAFYRNAGRKETAVVAVCVVAALGAAWGINKIRRHFAEKKINQNIIELETHGNLDFLECDSKGVNDSE